MRKVFIATTTGFWLAVGLFAAAPRWQPPAPPPPAAAVARSAAPAASAAAVVARLTQAELARHASPDDCWLAIAGEVYDITRYLPDHPSRPEVLTAWCGRDATAAYRTKNRGWPHSAEADALLPSYRVGHLVTPP